MADATDMAERHGRILAELSELALGLARDVQAAALSAEDPEAKARLGSAFHQVARTLRQTVALDARLARDLKRELREDRSDQRKEHRRAVHAHKAQVRARLKGLIWTEAEGEEAERLEDTLEGLLADDAVLDGFTDTPVEEHVARLRHDLGLNASPTPTGVGNHDVAEGAPGSHPADPDAPWRSSA